MRARVCCALIAALFCLSVCLRTTDAEGAARVNRAVNFTAGLFPEKPGVCPSKNLRIGSCVELCSRDRDCPKNQKCCSNGCGLRCMAPSKEKPGVCPRKILAVMCKVSCVNDIDCPKDEKCCRTRCGPECTPPLKVKPGPCLKPNVC